MKYLIFLAKLVLSVALLALVLSRIDASQVFDLLLRPETLVGILIAIAALFFQAVLAAYRQMEIVAIFGDRIGLLPSLRVWFSGLFVSQVAVTFIAGDVVRGIQLAKMGIPRRTSGRAIVLDRLIGLAVLLLMVLAVLPYVLALATGAHLRLGLILLGGASIGGLLAIAGAGFLPSFVSRLGASFIRHRLVDISVDLASAARFLTIQPRRSIRIAGLSFFMHLLNVFGIVAIARTLGVNAPAGAVAAIAIPVMLMTILPISFAGWGVREAAMVTGLGLLNVRSELALAISVGFGLSLLAASLPGLFCLLRKSDGIQVERSFQASRN